MLKSVQEKQGLVAGSRGCKPLDAAHVPGMPEVKVSRQLEHYRTKQDNWPFSYLAAKTRNSVKPRGQVASQSCFEKPDSSHSILTPCINTPFTHEERELPERILREKPQRKTRLIHPQSSLRDYSNSSTLFLSIVKFLRGLLSKPFLTIFISVRRLFSAL